MSDWMDEHLTKAADAFDIFEKQVFDHGELDRKTKELVAVAAGTVLRSEDSVESHATAAQEYGATDEEIAAALGVAWLTTGSTQIYWMQDKYEDILGTAWYKKHLTEASKKFGAFHDEIFDDSVLDRKTAELVGIGVSVVARCEHCTEAHMKQAMDNGASEQEAAEAVGVAWSVGASSQVGWTDVYDDVLE